jgi:hypothetical protein
MALRSGPSPRAEGLHCAGNRSLSDFPRIMGMARKSRAKVSDVERLQGLRPASASVCVRYGLPARETPWFEAGRGRNSQRTTLAHGSAGLVGRATFHPPRIAAPMIVSDVGRDERFCQRPRRVNRPSFVSGGDG